jgi:hypothetical protein
MQGVGRLSGRLVACRDSLLVRLRGAAPTASRVIGENRKQESPPVVDRSASSRKGREESKGVRGPPRADSRKSGGSTGKVQSAAIARVRASRHSIGIQSGTGASIGTVPGTYEEVVAGASRPGGGAWRSEQKVTALRNRTMYRLREQ